MKRSVLSCGGGARGGAASLSGRAEGTLVVICLDVGGPCPSGTDPEGADSFLLRRGEACRVIPRAGANH